EDMLVYPQLRSNALGQYPIRRRRTLRTVINTAGDERTVRLTDPGAEMTEWRLEYRGLIESEAAALRAFFAQCEGTLNGVTFLDPAGNLLGWSETLSDAVWTRGPLLSVAGAIGDPLGGARASRLTNTG